MARLPYDRNINPYVAYAIILVIGIAATTALMRAIDVVDAASAAPVSFFGNQ